MTTRTTRADYRAALRLAAHPPVRDTRFWIIQSMVLLVAGVHLYTDLHLSIETGAFPSGVPVALLILPVSYAALRYGLAGAVATALWAVLLWLPDLLLPRDRGHVGGDLIELALVVAVAVVFGRRIDAERLAHERVERATAASLAFETRYHRLFETNRSPILVLDLGGDVADANPSARTLFGEGIVGISVAELVKSTTTLEEQAGHVLTLADGQDYRLDVVAVPAGGGEPSTQVTFEDVTEERSEGRRATRYAQLVVDAEEDQRRRLARELHDEPLQLFLLLARRLESLGEVAGVPDDVAHGLDEIRRQALDAAARLRSLARDLRPPTLDELGLVAALSSLVSDVEDEGQLDAELKVDGAEGRLAADVELGAFRIAQEAMRNALRHARARHLTVTVAFGDRELSMTIVDDGLGFVPEVPGDREADHLGMLGMRERARLLGGRIVVQSEPGHGTVVEAVIPLDGPRTASGATR
jgi:signal transduction histidine kinase